MITKTDLTGLTWEEALGVVATLYEEMAEMEKRAEKAEADNATLRAALEECVYFADNSQGIVGWHLNGDILPWDQVEAIAQARAALAGGKEASK